MKMNTIINQIIVAGFAVSAGLYIPASSAATFTLGTESDADFERAKVLASPEPVIPAELHEQCYKSCCIAKFLIHPDGKTNVQLLTSSGSREVDELALETLRKWQFKPATLDGKPIESSRKVKVEFEVE
jgi:protein TonB